MFALSSSMIGLREHVLYSPSNLTNASFCVRQYSMGDEGILL